MSLSSEGMIGPLHRPQWQIQDFPDGVGGPNLKVGRQPIIWLKFSRKLHENEIFLTQMGTAPPWYPPPPST